MKPNPEINWVEMDQMDLQPWELSPSPIEIRLQKTKEMAKLA